MKVLITGAKGQLGLDLVDAFEVGPAQKTTGAPTVDVVGLAHADLDVSDEPAVWAAVRDHEPDLVVHAAAWTDVDGCEGDPDRAHRVNALGSWWVARACEAAGAAMVMVSTDYVFDGTGAAGPGGEPTPYTEFQPIDPLNAYGRSKAAGEQLVRQTLDEHYIVRTAWVNGARGSNFVKTMLRVGRERGEARVVDDQVGSPTFTRDLAAAIRELAVSGRYGTYHRTNSGTCSWYELAAATYELAGVDVDLAPQKSSDLDRPAPRPAYSVLSDRHSVQSGLSPLPHWREGLRDLLTELGELAHR
ncbi:MAG: dTDP-4-dehydrorhamnose reductase [Actinobacteria bacterium]|nr:dTDP-4-dehydrorhamnose reductase [Actinomycetota bacterium]